MSEDMSLQSPPTPSFGYLKKQLSFRPICDGKVERELLGTFVTAVFGAPAFPFHSYYFFSIIIWGAEVGDPSHYISLDSLYIALERMYFKVFVLIVPRFVS